MFKTKMLVSVSTPWASQKHGAAIADLAKRLEAQVVVAHVAHGQADDVKESDAKQRGEQTIKLMCDTLAAAGITAEGVLLFSDDVAKAILNTAKARGATVIVMGLSNQGALRRFFRRDVPAEVVRGAEVPVLLCQAEWMGSV